jgi:hypothetical protein
MEHLASNGLETSVRRLSSYVTSPVDFSSVDEEQEEKKKMVVMKATANCFYIIANY